MDSCALHKVMAITLTCEEMALVLKQCLAPHIVRNGTLCCGIRNIMVNRRNEREYMTFSYSNTQNAPELGAFCVIDVLVCSMV
jgi:hypothetical protein